MNEILFSKELLENENIYTPQCFSATFWAAANSLYWIDWQITGLPQWFILFLTIHFCQDLSKLSRNYWLDRNKSQFRNKNEPIYFLTYCLETFQATINFVEKNGGNKGIEINLHNYVAWCIIIRDITHVWASSADAPMCWAALASNYSWKA